MIGGIEGNGFCSSLVAYTAAMHLDRPKWKSDIGHVTKKGWKAVFVDFMKNRDFMKFLQEYNESDTRIVPQVNGILARQIRYLRDNVYNSKEWGSLGLIKKSGSMYASTQKRPDIPRDGENYVPYWLAIEDFCGGNGNSEGAFYSRVHIILWTELKYPANEDDYSAVGTINLANLMSTRPFDMYLFCDNQPRKTLCNSKWLFSDLIDVFEHSPEHSISTSVFFGGNHFDLLVDDPKEDLLKAHKGHFNQRTSILESIFENLVDEMWGVFKKHHDEKVAFSVPFEEDS